MEDETVSIDITTLRYNAMLINNDLLELLLDKQNHEQELRKNRQRRYYLKHAESLRLYQKNYYEKFKLGHLQTPPIQSD